MLFLRFDLFFDIRLLYFFKSQKLYTYGLAMRM